MPVRGSDSDWRVFPHNGMDKLERLLADAEENQLQVVVTESIFSMDGDAADLRVLRSAEAEHSFVLLLDEAHASGVYGRNGAGLAAEQGLAEIVDIFIVTFSKAAGCLGGAICGTEKFCQAVMNLGRAYLFSTSVPAAIAATIEAAIGVMRDEPERRKRLRESSKGFPCETSGRRFESVGGRFADCSDHRGVRIGGDGVFGAAAGQTIARGRGTAADGSATHKPAQSHSKLRA